MAEVHLSWFDPSLAAHHEDEMIKLKRASCFPDRLRAYKVILDGKMIGKIKNGEELEFNSPAGKHQLCLKIDWCSSNTIDFEMQGSQVEFECGSSLTGGKVLLALLYT